MTETTEPRREVRHIRPKGFLIRHHTIWLSEFISNIVVYLLLISLMSITAVIFFNVRAMHRHDLAITTLKAANAPVEHQVEALRKELRVVTILRTLATLAEKRVADSTLCRVGRLICRNSDQYGYDPLLLVAVIHVEGVFDPTAQGRFRSGTPSGAMGLMQLKFETAAEVARQLSMPELTENDLYKPDINLVLGVAYLTRLIAQFKSFKLGLIAYNEGPGMVLYTLMKREPLPLEYYRMVLQSYYTCKKIAERLDKQ